MKALIWLLSVLILMTLSAMGGYYFGSRNGTRSAPTVYQPQEINSLQNSLGSGIKTQIATYQGTLVDVSNNQLTIKGDDDKTNVFKLDANFGVAINHIASQSSQEAKLSALNSLKGKKVQAILEVVNGNYLVKNISQQ